MRQPCNQNPSCRSPRTAHNPSRRHSRTAVCSETPDTCVQGSRPLRAPVGRRTSKQSPSTPTVDQDTSEPELQNRRQESTTARKHKSARNQGSPTLRERQRKSSKPRARSEHEKGEVPCGTHSRALKAKHPRKCQGMPSSWSRMTSTWRHPGKLQAETGMVQGTGKQNIPSGTNYWSTHGGCHCEHSATPSVFSTSLTKAS